MIIESTIAKASLSGLANGVKSVACMIGKKALDRGVKEALDRAFEPALRSSLTNFALLEQALFALNLTTAETNALESFFKSGAFASFIRAIGLLAVADRSALVDQHEVLNAYIGTVLHGKSSGSVASLSAAILEFVETAAPEAWETASNLGVIGQSWNSESIIQSLVSDQISNARQQLEQRIALSSTTFREVEIFLGRFKRGARFATSKLKPQSIHESPSVPVEDLYVEPLVNFISDKGLTECPRDMLFASSRRSVLIGNPGGGKSTLAGKLCHDICADVLDNSSFEVPELAAQVVLRDYAQYQKNQACSIVEYLEVHSKSELQIDAPTGAFKLLLLSGRILIIFDGLDELIDIKDRSAVRSAVEHFALEYPVAPILVTSREVGYEQAPLDKTKFAHYKLSPFGAEQVGRYATKWFRYSCRPSMEEGKRLAAAFMADSSIVPDIRSNPLMLGLLCNLYRQDGFIPKNRPEVYQRCADLLFTKWDRSRGISIRLPLDHRLRPAMSFLAHWIYSDEELQTGVTEDRLITETSRYLRQWVEDDAEAMNIAQEFITFFSGRAWVFTDTGSDKTQRLYQFTHRTFLEYFTADELVRLFPRAEDLHAHLIEKIENQSWDVVCQLAYQLIVQRTFSYNTMVELLCQSARAADLREKLNVLSFLARTMDLLYPMPPARRDAVRLCLETVGKNLDVIEDSSDHHKTLALEILNGVFGTSAEALKLNASEINNTLRLLLLSDELSATIIVPNLILWQDFTVILTMSASRDSDDGRRRFWNEQAKLLAQQVAPVRESFADSDVRIALQSWWRHEKTSAEILRLFGPAALFYSVRYPLSTWFRTSIANFVLNWSLDPSVADRDDALLSTTKKREWMAKETKAFGALLLKSDPWIQIYEPLMSYDPVEHFFLSKEDSVVEWPQESSVSESLLVCLAVMRELQGQEPRPWVLSTGTLRDLAAFSYARAGSEFLQRAHQVVEERCESKVAKERLHAWVQGETTFTRAAEKHPGT